MSQVIESIVKKDFYINFSYDGNQVKTAPSSKYAHSTTSIGRFNNTPIVVGNKDSFCFGSYKGRSRTVEGFQNERWMELSNFPFVKCYIYSFSMVTFKDVLYLFGKLIRFHYSLIFNLLKVVLVTVNGKAPWLSNLRVL